jgi:glycerol-3-phosphate dehydrogenase
VRDQQSDRNLNCHAKIVINATGVWMEETLRLPEEPRVRSQRAFARRKAFT